MKTKRALILVFDSFGIGASLDAPSFGDAGADTFGHIAEAAQSGLADNAKRRGPLKLPNLTRLGLVGASLASTGIRREGLDYDAPIAANFGYAVERSRGKDTPSGHWEMAGLPVDFDWGYFPPEYPSFPRELVQSFIDECHLDGILGNKHASGTAILDELGEAHIRTKQPIIYTSADSVFQIACHEQHFGLDRLYAICETARTLVDPYRIGRVIARPFIGEKPGAFERTANRRDYATPPHDETLLDIMTRSGRRVISIGKIADIFAHRGIDETIKGQDNLDLFDKMLARLDSLGDGELLFANFVDFDSKYGHRRDTAGYAQALEALDARLPELEAKLQPGDIAIITADHGCDPTLPGSDHTREHVPILAFGPEFSNERFIGRRESFADIGQSIAEHLELPFLKHGVSFL